MAWIEYEAVERFYGEQRAERSGERYMTHIDDGIAVLEAIRATERAMRAFCLHPLVQSDEALHDGWHELGEVTNDPRVLALAFEYRHIANNYLSTRDIDSPSEIALSPLGDVNDMLRADKVQNHFDFLRFHQRSHPREAALRRYFHNWFVRLDLLPRLDELNLLLDRRHANRAPAL